MNTQIIELPDTQIRLKITRPITAIGRRPLVLVQFAVWLLPPEITPYTVAAFFAASRADLLLPVCDGMIEAIPTEVSLAKLCGIEAGQIMCPQTHTYQSKETARVPVYSWNKENAFWTIPDQSIDGFGTLNTQMFAFLNLGFN